MNPPHAKNINYFGLCGISHKLWITDPKRNCSFQTLVYSRGTIVSEELICFLELVAAVTFLLMISPVEFWGPFCRAGGLVVGRRNQSSWTWKKYHIYIHLIFLHQKRSYIVRIYIYVYIYMYIYMYIYIYIMIVYMYSRWFYNDISHG